jgi:hypothetical protein
VELCYVELVSRWDHGYIESFNKRPRPGAHRHLALGYRVPVEYAAACRPTACVGPGPLWLISV